MVFNSPKLEFPPLKKQNPKKMLSIRKLQIAKSFQFLYSFTIKSPICSSTTTTTIPDIPSCTYYDARINEAGREGDFATVHHLLNKRVSDGFFNTNNTFKFVSTTNVSTILDNLLESISSLGNGFARKSAYDALIARLSKMQCVKEATRVAETMARAGHAPNNVTFHPIVNALAKMEEFDHARRVMELMRSLGVAPDLTTYNYLLTGYCFTGDLASAAKVLVEMEEGGLGADTRTYDALVLGACRAGKVDAALALLRRMVEDGVSPLYCTHTHVIGALLKHNCFDQAVEFVRSYAGSDVKLDSENFGILAARLIARGKLEDAKELVKEMCERRLVLGPRLKDFYTLHVSSS